MRHPSPSQIRDGRPAGDAIVDVVADGTPLVGSLHTLAQALNLTVTDLRSVLRELLEAGHIAVSAGAWGQFTIYRQPRRPRMVPTAPPTPDDCQ